jgi:hypothetical protein
MSPSQPPLEGQDKAVDEPVEAGALGRFRNLASRLFAVDPKVFNEAKAKDEKERAKRRALRGRGG